MSYTLLREKHHIISIQEWGCEKPGIFCVPFFTAPFSVIIFVLSIFVFNRQQSNFAKSVLDCRPFCLWALRHPSRPVSSVITVSFLYAIGLFHLGDIQR